VIREWWTVNDLEGSGRGLTLSYYSSICLDGLRQSRKTSDREASLRAEIWTRDLPNSKQECWQIDHWVRHNWTLEQIVTLQTTVQSPSTCSITYHSSTTPLASIITHCSGRRTELIELSAQGFVKINCSGVLLQLIYISAGTLTRCLILFRMKKTVNLI
jgi:hypothetical protein